jgi:uncharacterized membrane protein
MESKAKLLGHPIHPMLIVFPLGLFIASVVMDVLFMINNNQSLAVASFYNIGGGILGGLLAAIFGFRDYAAIPDNTRAKRVGTMHGFGNLIVLVLFSVSWLLRYNAPEFIPPLLAIVLSMVGFVIAAITGWLGGELVNRLGVSVDPGANLEALSSIAPVETRDATYVAEIPVTGEPPDKDEP